ncbi:MAG: hypothetical protein WEE64_00435 [Dehalococcoidia bacterium]
MDKFFNAMDDSFSAMFDAIKQSNERGYKFSRRVIREVESGQRELRQLGRRFAREPRDMRGAYQASVDLAKRTAGNSGDLAREWLSTAVDARQQAQSTAMKLAQANRAAAQALGTAVQEGTRDLTQRARERMTARPAAVPKKAAPARRKATKRRTTRRTTRKAATPRAAAPRAAAPAPTPITPASSTPSGGL